MGPRDVKTLNDSWVKKSAGKECLSNGMCISAQLLVTAVYT